MRRSDRLLSPARRDEQARRTQGVPGLDRPESARPQRRYLREGREGLRRALLRGRRDLLHLCRRFAAQGDLPGRRLPADGRDGVLLQLRPLVQGDPERRDRQRQDHRDRP